MFPWIYSVQITIHYLNLSVQQHLFYKEAQINFVVPLYAVIMHFGGEAESSSDWTIIINIKTKQNEIKKKRG